MRLVSVLSLVMALPVLVQFMLRWSQISAECSFYYAANTAFQTAGVLLSLRHSPPRLNWPLWIRRSSSMPEIVIAAVLNRLKPSIGPSRSFTPR